MAEIGGEGLLESALAADLPLAFRTPRVLRPRFKI
jgi:hypothetical protein